MKPLEIHFFDPDISVVPTGNFVGTIAEGIVSSDMESYLVRGSVFLGSRDEVIAGISDASLAARTGILLELKVSESKPI